MTQTETWFMDKFYEARTPADTERVAKEMLAKLDTCTEQERENYSWYLEGLLVQL